MWHSLFHSSVSILELSIRIVSVFVFILILLRISGKRQLGQLSAIEFVSILLISNAVQNAMNAGDNSLTGGLFLAFALVVLSMLTAVLTYRSRKIRHLIEGTPTILIRKGEIIQAHLQKELINSEELKVMLRRQGIHSVHNVELAILESDGNLTVTCFDKALEKPVS